LPQKKDCPFAEAEITGEKMKLLNMVLPLTPQPYKNIITFFLSMLKNVDSKEELEQIGELLAKALEDGKISSKEWLAIGGKNGLGILGGK
tara:strand:+ start:101 stop:370 length:270 start_codon:yes stop_codon:yes gene_type:complete